MNYSKEDILDYINNVMSSERRQDFERAIQEDQRLKHQLEMEQLLVRGIQYYGRKDFKKRVERVMKSERKKIQLKRLALAVLLILVSLSLYVFFIADNEHERVVDIDQIYASHYTTPNISISNRRTGDLENLSGQFQIAYDNKKFAEIVSFVESTPGMIDTLTHLQLIYGIALMEREGYQKANQVFAKIIEADDPIFGDQARWYQALTFIKMNLINSAEVQLEVLARDGHRDFHKEAKLLLKEID